MRDFSDRGGYIRAYGTCLKIRELEESEMCPLYMRKDLYELVKESDKVRTFKNYGFHPLYLFWMDMRCL